MINLRHRSYQKELMDGDHIPFPAIAQTLKELNIINTRLGGHSITLKGIRDLKGNKKDLVVCEIGCGGGDNLFAIHTYCQKNKIPAKFIGIDINPECIEFARQQYPDMPCEWICNDYALIDLSGNRPDIIFSSLFCHHFTDEELVRMLRWQGQNCNEGFFINDLHRHWLAYYLIKYITKYFSKSYLVKNDACLSVARSFRKHDWRQLFLEAGVTLSSIKWKWAFRWLVIGKKESIAG